MEPYLEDGENSPIKFMKWNGPLVPLAPRLERETRDRGNN